MLSLMFFFFILFNVCDVVYNVGVDDQGYGRGTHLLRTLLSHLTLTTRQQLLISAFETLLVHYYCKFIK